MFSKFLLSKFILIPCLLNFNGISDPSWEYIYFNGRNFREVKNSQNFMDFRELEISEIFVG